MKFKYNVCFVGHQSMILDSPQQHLSSETICAVAGQGMSLKKLLQL
jgi:hypothetical protein